MASQAPDYLLLRHVKTQVLIGFGPRHHGVPAVPDEDVHVSRPADARRHGEVTADGGAGNRDLAGQTHTAQHPAAAAAGRATAAAHLNDG